GPRHSQIWIICAVLRVLSPGSARENGVLTFTLKGCSHARAEGQTDSPEPRRRRGPVRRQRAPAWNDSPEGRSAPCVAGGRFGVGGGCGTRAAPRAEAQQRRAPVDGGGAGGAARRVPSWRSARPGRRAARPYVAGHRGAVAEDRAALAGA